MEQKEKIKGDKGAMIRGGDDSTMVDMVTKKEGQRQYRVSDDSFTAQATAEDVTVSPDCLSYKHTH